MQTTYQIEATTWSGEVFFRQSGLSQSQADRRCIALTSRGFQRTGGSAGKFICLAA